MKAPIYLLAGAMLLAVLAAGWFLRSESSAPPVPPSESKNSAAALPMAEQRSAPQNRVAKDQDQQPPKVEFEDQPEGTAPKKDDAVLVFVPPGASAAALEVRELDPKLRLPASLAASSPSIPISQPQEFEKQRIARDFLQEVALARAVARNSGELAAQWRMSQRSADQRLLAVVGPKTFGQQVEAINPEINEQASANRRATQRRMIDMNRKQQADAASNPPESLSNPELDLNDPGLPNPPRSYTELEGKEIRENNQAHLFEMFYGEVLPWMRNRGR